MGAKGGLFALVMALCAAACGVDRDGPLGCLAGRGTDEAESARFAACVSDIERDGHSSREVEQALLGLGFRCRRIAFNDGSYALCSRSQVIAPLMAYVWNVTLDRRDVEGRMLAPSMTGGGGIRAP